MSRLGNKFNSSSQIVTLLSCLLICGSYLSYTASDDSVFSLLGYGIAVGALIFSLLKCYRFNNLIISKAFLIFFLYSMATLISIFYNLGDSFKFVRFLQELFYPLVIFIVLLTGYQLIGRSNLLLLNIITILAIINFSVAFLSIVGVLSSLGPFGDVKMGRYIFGTTVRSSSGLMSNVNYYASTQSALGFLYGLVASIYFGVLKRRHWIIMLLIISSSVLGSSRGVTLASLWSITYLIYFSVSSARLQGKFIFYMGAALALLTGGIYYDTLYEVFRMERGLNARDDIWVTVLDAWLDRPILGWGMEGDVAMGVYSYGDLEGRSTHSGYLHLLLKGGIVSFIIVYGLLFYFYYWSIKRRNLYFVDRFAIACIIFYLINSLFRVYSVGGVGLIPLLPLLALSVLMYRKNEILKRKF